MRAPFIVLQRQMVWRTQAWMALGALVLFTVSAPAFAQEQPVAVDSDRSADRSEISEIAPVETP